MEKKKPVSYRRKRRIGATIIPIITLTVLTVAVSAAIAGVWQLADPVEYIPTESSENRLAPMPAESSSAQSQPEDAQSQPEDGQSQPEASSDAQSQETDPDGLPEVGDAAAYQVSESEWVGTDYFDDALFVGDSITEGIKLYDIMSNATVLSYTGINLDNIFTRQVIGAGENKVTIIDAARELSPGKIYVMMGANSMLASKESFIASYGRLVDALQEMHPGATVYIQSILPVTVEYEQNRPEFANDKIEEYNLALRRMAKDRNMPYLDVAEAFRNEAGALPTEASPKDGMHFSAQWYRKWFDYLREHVQL